MSTFNSFLRAVVCIALLAFGSGWNLASAPDQQRRFIAAYSADLRPAHAWDIVGLAGAGAIRSTADDMLKYLEANLHPQMSAAKSSANLIGWLTYPDGRASSPSLPRWLF